VAICGCQGRCTCSLSPGANVNITGSGDSNDPYIINAQDSPTFSAVDSDGSMQILPGGALGHTPALAVRIDPDSEAPVTVSGAGLKIDVPGGTNSVDDTDSIDLEITAGVITGDVILDPDGGLVTNPGLGVAIASVPEQIVYAANDTFTKASYPGLRAIRVIAVGGGGATGGTAATAGGQSASSAGGGAGEYAESIILASALAAGETVTVGAGGTKGAAGNNAGTNGGASSFGAFVAANGGGSSPGGSAGSGAGFTGAGLGGTGGTGDILIPGGDGGFAGRLSSDPSVPIPVNRGGASQMSTEARSPNVSAGTAFDGKDYGGGAGGQSAGASTAARAGADGADGVVIVEILV